MNIYKQIRKIFRYLHEDRWMLGNYPYTLFFNFRYLPFKQAVHVPILIRKPHIHVRGKIKITAPYISHGMIKLGKNAVNIYEDSGITMNIYGEIIFGGCATIGNHSFISVSKSGVLEIGEKFRSTADLKLVCYNSIKFHDNVLIGWNCLFTDTDLLKCKILTRE